MCNIKFILFFATVIGNTLSVKLPPSITPCSRSLPKNQLGECLLQQSKSYQPIFAKGIPEWGLPSIDPLTLSDVSSKTGTFILREKNLVLKGLRKMEVKEIVWDLENKVGRTRIYGNLSLTSNYEADGTLLVFPVTGNGKLTVKMFNTEILLKYKIRFVKDSAGVEHVETYDLKPTQTYELVKLHLSNILGGTSAAISDTINKVLNDNWRSLFEEMGPPHTVAISNRVHEIINQFYSQIPSDELLAP